MVINFPTRAFTIVAIVYGILASANAGEMKVDHLVAMSNDRDDAINDISFVTDAKGVVINLLYVVRESGKVTTRKLFAVTQLAEADGAVLEEERGVKALSLHGRVNSQIGRGSLYIRFVANGMTGEFKTCAMQALRNPKGVWQILNARSLKPITQAKMRTWALGIQTIEGICSVAFANVVFVEGDRHARYNGSLVSGFMEDQFLNTWTTT